MPTRQKRILPRWIACGAVLAAAWLVIEWAWSTPPIPRPPISRPPGYRPPTPYPPGGGSVIPIPIPIPIGPIRPVRPPNTYTPNYVPNTTQEEPATVQPNVEPQVNEILEPLIDALANVSPFDLTYAVSSDDIQAMRDQTQGRNVKAIDAIVAAVLAGLTDEIDKLGGKLTAEQKQQITSVITEGNDIATLLTAEQRASAAGQRLLRRGELIRAIRGLRAAAANGTLNVGDLVKIDNQIRTQLAPNTASLTAIQDALGTLGFNGEFIRILGTAAPGNNPVPRGFDVTIILVPGMGAGRLLPLGNGAVLVGTGLGKGDIIVGTGNVALAAGVGSIGPPAPETGEPRAVVGGVLIRNKNNETVKYMVNDSNFSIANGQSQTLPKGQDWTVAFDRGGEFGTAKYGLGEGTYDFTPTTDKGWELFNQSFEVTIDNSQNPKQFHFVLNNKRQTVSAREKSLHKSDFPISVRFDNAKGKTKQKMLDSGEFRVALVDDFSLELFPPNSVPKALALKSDTLPPGFKMFANPFAKKMKVAADTVSPSKSSIRLFGPESNTN